MKTVLLTKGKVAVIDDADLPSVNQFKWTATHSNRNKWYAVRNEKGKRIYLHRWLLDAPFDVKVDHRDGDGLNCQRDNIRLAPQSKNAMNLRKYASNTSGYKGVSRKDGKWRMTINVNGKQLQTQGFETPEAAARAYDEKAKELHGEFASLNFAE